MGSVDHLPPILSNYTRVGNAGQVTVSQVAPADITMIFAFSQFNSTVAAVGVRVGPGVAVLNFAAFMSGANEIPVLIVGAWRTAAVNWMMSLPSNVLWDAVSLAPTCRPRQAPGLEERT